MKLVKPLTYEESIKLLINGVCGSNPTLIGRETTISRVSVYNWLEGKNNSNETRDIIGMWLWRKLNKNVLLNEDELPASSE